MSVTFSLPCEFCTVSTEDRKRMLALPCPKCKGHNRYSGVENLVEADNDCSDCYGYGGDSKAEDALHYRRTIDDGEFNVANGNAAYIVRELLNRREGETEWGHIDPTTVLMRLAAVFDTSNGVVAPSDTQAVHLTANGVGLGCHVINAGRSQRQADSYVSRLRRLAEIAIERGAPEIVWG